jgi:hypothetical protein
VLKQRYEKLALEFAQNAGDERDLDITAPPLTAINPSLTAATPTRKIAHCRSVVTLTDTALVKTSCRDRMRRLRERRVVGAQSSEGGGSWRKRAETSSVDFYDLTTGTVPSKSGGMPDRRAKSERPGCKGNLLGTHAQLA